MVLRNQLILCLQLMLLLLTVLPGEGDAATTAREKYARAESCQNELLSDPRQQKYRHRWLGCIRRFQAVYQHNPQGPWAAAGLYRTADLYRKLYHRSGRDADRREAVDLCQRLVKRFPKSAYKAKATTIIKTLARADARADNGDADNAGKLYYQGKQCFQRLEKSPQKMQYRHHWLRCVKPFDRSLAQDPHGPWAAASLYRSAELYEALYQKSRRKADHQEGIRRLKTIVADFPQSRYHARAVRKLRTQTTEWRPPLPDPKPVMVDPKPSPEPAKRHRNALSPDASRNADSVVSSSSTTVTGIRYWSNPSYTRVVIDANLPTEYHNHQLPWDLANDKPQRVFVDLKKSRLGPDIAETVKIDDDLLSRVRAAQYDAETVRVVVDIKHFKTYKVFALRNPFRVVIDVWGAKQAPRDPPVVSAMPVPPDSKQGMPSSALARQLALNVRRIVIDPGHGGHDYGAPGIIKGVHEKNVVLAIARKLARKIRDQLHCEVILTRDDDRFLALEERTAIANTHEADLFISIHTNAHRKASAYGIETFFLNLATDDEAILVAARENATSAKNISDLEAILNDLMQNAKINESSRLAVHIQDNLYNHLKKKYSHIRNKGVKQAPFYVLLGAQMPAILIETSFISNKRECKRLITPAYQNALCDAIVKGIRAYMKETNPTALSKPPGDNNRG